MSAEEIENQIIQDEALAIEIHECLKLLFLKVEQAKQQGLTPGLIIKKGFPAYIFARGNDCSYLMYFDEVIISQDLPFDIGVILENSILPSSQIYLPKQKSSTFQNPNQ